MHYAPHRLVDVQALGCDFLACSSYKFFGPHAGILWGRRELLERFDPYKVPPAPEEAPERWETGTQNHEGIAGILATVEWIASLGGEGAGGRRDALTRAYDAVHAHESTLFARLEDGLRAVRGVGFHGVARGEPRTPTAAITVEGRSPDEVARRLGDEGEGEQAGPEGQHRRLGDEGVFVWNGHFYATTVCDALELTERGGLVRAGIAPYTSDDDVERLIDGIEWIAG